VVLLADRSFADGKLVKYLQQTLKWHFRIRIKKRFQFQTSNGRWHKISDIKLAASEVGFTRPVQLGKTKPYGPVYLTFDHCYFSSCTARRSWHRDSDKRLTRTGKGA
jgi:hypothetical protein